MGAGMQKKLPHRQYTLMHNHAYNNYYIKQTTTWPASFRGRSLTHAADGHVTTSL